MNTTETKTQPVILDYISDRKQREAAKTAEGRKRYGELLLAGAKRGGNTPAEISELDQIIALLGIDQQTLEADAIDFRQMVSLEQLKPILAEAERDFLQAQAADDEFVTETQAIHEQRQMQQARLSSARNAAEARRLDLSTRLAELQIIRKRQWQNLAVENPDIASRRRHIVQTIFGEPAPAEYDDMALEPFLASKGANVDGIELIKRADQSAEDFDRLLRIVQHAKRVFPRPGFAARFDDGERSEFVYLAAGEMVKSPTTYRGVALVDAESVAAMQLSPLNTAIVPLPGQNLDELADLAAEVHKKVTARLVRDTDEWDAFRKTPFTLLGHAAQQPVETGRSIVYTEV